MAFDQSSMTEVDVRSSGMELLILWESEAAEGTFFQVYVEGRLAWYGTSRRCHVPTPIGPKGRNIWVDVGTVAPDEIVKDFSGGLSSRASGGAKTRLTWFGGTFLDTSYLDDILGFRIYRSTSPGLAVALSSLVDVVAAYPGGWISDGFGLGGFGSGRFGRAATFYEWTSSELPAGVWQFAVVPFDRAGNNRGAGQTISVMATSPPRSPAASSFGSKLNLSYSGPSSRSVVLNWMPSPSYTGVSDGNDIYSELTAPEAVVI